jgi:hypothetical protein
MEDEFRESPRRSCRAVLPREKKRAAQLVIQDHQAFGNLAVPIYSVVRFRPHWFCSLTLLHDKFRRPSGREQVVGDHTAGVPPVPIPNTEVKPRRADCTARVSVWESRSLPA